MPGMAALAITVRIDAQILGWQDDPGEAATPLVPPEARPVPDLTLSPLSLAIPGVTAPQPRSYDLASVDFRYWSAAEAAARGAAFWRQLLPQGTVWQLGDTLPIKLDEGEDFNAFYDRQALNFFHGTAAGRTVYSGESPDIVCHEQGHADTRRDPARIVRRRLDRGRRVPRILWRYERAPGGAAIADTASRDD